MTTDVPPAAVRVAAERWLELAAAAEDVRPYETAAYALAEQMLEAVVADEFAGDALVVAIDRRRREATRWDRTEEG